MVENKYTISIQDIYLAGIATLAIASIFINAYFTTSGGLTDDSARYLALARMLLEEGRFHLLSLEQAEIESQLFFTTWPVGYPAFIAVIAGSFGISVFLASKILGCLCIITFCITLRFTCGAQAYWFAFILLFAEYLGIFSATWSEGPFTVILCWFALIVCRTIEERGHLIINAGLLLALAFLLFLVRYIGAFSVGIIGFLALYMLLKHKRPQGFLLIVISTVAAMLMGLYLLNNYYLSGRLTGMDRFTPPESDWQLLQNTFSAIFAELTITHQHFHLRSLLPLVAQLLCFLFLFKIAIREQPLTLSRRPAYYSLSRVFAAIGFSYWSSIISLRWLAHFDPLDYRLLGPGTMLLWIALLKAAADSRKPDFINATKKALAAFAIISWLDTVQTTIVKNHGKPSFNECTEAISERYRAIPPVSVVVFAPREVHYLRTDLIITEPFFYPYYLESEPWVDFMRRAKSVNRPIFLDVPEKVDGVKFHSTVVDAVSSLKAGSIVQISP